MIPALPGILAATSTPVHRDAAILVASTEIEIDSYRGLLHRIATKRSPHLTKAQFLQPMSDSRAEILPALLQELGCNIHTSNDPAYASWHDLDDERKDFQLLSILYSAGTLQHSQNHVLPSWVPDWTFAVSGLR
jgi:hypothetical protein